MPRPSIFSLPALARVFYFSREFRRIGDHAAREDQRQDADRDVDEENPAPGPVVGDPAAERRADGRRGDDGHAVEREGGGAFGGGERIDEDGLLDGGEAAAADSLQHAEEDEQPRLGANPQRSELTVKSVTQIM